MKTAFNLLVVALGGAIGSAARYGFSLLLGPVATGFPLGTLGANVTGCLILGFVTELAGLKTGLSPELRLLFATGICGGLTTLSSFLFETNRLLLDRELLMAALYAVLTLLVSFAALWGGMLGCRALFMRS
jgi:CrcB protein